MISVKIRRNAEGYVYGYTVEGHADASVVCPSVSLLAINTANSIHALTDEPIDYDHDSKKGGFLQVDLSRVKDGHKNKDANLLLESLILGLQSVKDKYGSEIEIEDDNHG